LDEFGNSKVPNTNPYYPWDWYIYLHLVDFYGTKVNIPYMDPMGNTNPFLVQPGWFLGVYVGTQKNHLRYLRLLKLLFV